MIFCIRCDFISIYYRFDFRFCSGLALRFWFFLAFCFFSDLTFLLGLVVLFAFVAFAFCFRPSFYFLFSWALHVSNLFTRLSSYGSFYELFLEKDSHFYKNLTKIQFVNFFREHWIISSKVTYFLIFPILEKKTKKIGYDIVPSIA